MPHQSPATGSSRGCPAAAKANSRTTPLLGTGFVRVAKLAVNDEPRNPLLRPRCSRKNLF
jgi:hypothetical protein